MIPAVAISQLFFSFGTRHVLEEVELSIAHGEFAAIIGPNGGGKTTLLRLMLGFLLPSQGKVALFGRPPTEMQRRIGYVPQMSRSDRDFPITVQELVRLGALWHRPSYPLHTKEAALYWIDELGLTSYRNQPFASLSGGLTQRALLARALVANPDLLLLDEPTANIDPHSKALILEKLHSFRGKTTILLVTHDLSMLTEGIDQILYVEKNVHPYQPQEVCQHFALGLYHTPTAQQGGVPMSHVRSQNPQSVLQKLTTGSGHVS